MMVLVVAAMLGWWDIAGQAPSRPPGDVDPLLGPATRVEQGVGMTDEIRAALSPGPQHAVLARLTGDWTSVDTSGAEPPPASTLTVRPLLGGGWYEMRTTTR